MDLIKPLIVELSQEQHDAVSHLTAMSVLLEICQRPADITEDDLAVLRDSANRAVQLSKAMNETIAALRHRVLAA